jgi:ABC-type phosphate transport system ATPase subunit
MFPERNARRLAALQRQQLVIARASALLDEVLGTILAPSAGRDPSPATEAKHRPPSAPLA